MNPLDKLLSKTPPSDDTWHCPWFRLIEAFALNGVFFGTYSFFVEDASVGLVAVIIGLTTGAFSFGSRSRNDTTC